jgi:hypothetical protein
MNDQPLNATKVDTSQGTVIAFASTEAPGKRQWTELVVYWLPCPDGRQFLADIVGKSTVKGHSTLRRPIYVRDLERALQHFDDSDLGESVRIQARDWLDQNQDRVRDARTLLGAPIVGFTGNGLGEALRWLYGEISEGGASMRLSIDFHIPDRTVRDALKKEGEGKQLTGWARAFLKALRHFDRAGIALVGEAA